MGQRWRWSCSVGEFRDTAHMTMGKTTGEPPVCAVEALASDSIELGGDSRSREKEARHARVIQAMLTIRKALRDTSKIRLGDQYHFELKTSECNGWPILRLELVDKKSPDKRDYVLIVRSNDDLGRGNISTSLHSGPILGEVDLREARQFHKIPVLLKHSVREFLDVIAAYVLPQKQEKGTSPDTSAVIQEKTPTKKVTGSPSGALAGLDLFDDEGDSSDNVVSHEEGETIPLELEL